MGNAASRRSRKDAAIAPDAVQIPKVIANQTPDETGINIELHRKYKFRNVDGEFTVAELVEMEFANDERYQRLRKRDLPPDFWALWRIERNRRRSQRNRERRRERTAEIEGDLTEEQKGAKLLAAREAGREQQRRLTEGLSSGVKIIVDCSFASSAGSSDREVRSLARQLQFCLAANRKSPKPGNLVFAGFAGALREFACGRMNAASWQAHMKEESASDLITPGSKVVVLSPDGEEALSTVDSDTIYIVGGLVDRTVQKGVTATFAERAAWPARRLPLQEYLGVSAVLNVNDVVGALLMVHGGASWQEALEEVVPQRRRRPGKDRRREERIQNEE